MPKGKKHKGQKHPPQGSKNGQVKPAESEWPGPDCEADRQSVGSDSSQPLWDSSDLRAPSRPPSDRDGSLPEEANDEDQPQDQLMSVADDLSELIDLLAEKNTKRRMEAIGKLNMLFTKKYVGDLLIGNLLFFSDALARGIKRSGGAERQDTCRLSMLLAAQVGEEEVVARTLGPVLLTLARDPSARMPDRVGCLQAAGIVSYLTIADPRELGDLSEEFASFLSVREDHSALCRTALNTWALLLSVSSYPRIVDVVKKKIPTLLALMDSKSLEVKVSAGQAAALLFELVPQDCESVDEEWGWCVERLEALAGENSRHVERKERSHQRMSFRDIHQSLESGYVKEQKFSIDHERVLLDSWARIMQYNAIKELLGAGTATHMKENPFLRESFGLPPEHRKLTSEDRMTESKGKKLVYAIVAKERCKVRGKQRDKRTEVFRE